MKNRLSKFQRYFLEQKLIGLGIFLFGVLVAFIAEGDITVSLFIWLGGIYLMFTKKAVVETNLYFEIQDELDKYEQRRKRF